MGKLTYEEIKKSCEGKGNLNIGQGHAGNIPKHLNAVEHVTGRSIYIGDMIPTTNMLYAQVYYSTIAKGKIKSINTQKALETPGVEAVYTADDIPGNNLIGAITKDEHLLAKEEVSFIGEPVALVLGDTLESARLGKKMILVNYEEETPVVDPLKAHSLKDYIGPDRVIERGDVNDAFKNSDHVITGTVENGGQEHFYLETQSCRAVPDEDGTITLYSSSQNPTEVQAMAAIILGVDRKDIIVDIKRMGGGFGGKESQATTWACIAGLGAYLSGKPVELVLERHEDGAFTGKRHPVVMKYKAGFNKDGKITALDYEVFMNSGAVADLTMPVMGRLMSHSDNVYNVDNFRIKAYPCRTNLPPFTAFRGFGVPQGVFLVENVIHAIARELEMDPNELRLKNLYKKGNTTHYGQIITDDVITEIMERIIEKSDYYQRRKEIDEFNRKNRFEKKGIATVPVKFGISFNAPHLNQGMSLIMVYGDGSVSCSHGGTEMGQEVNTKVAQVVATELGIDISRVKILSNSTTRTANVAPTAASTGSDLNGQAASRAALKIRERLARFAAPMMADSERGISPDWESLEFRNNRITDLRNPDISIEWNELINKAIMARVNLGAQGFYATPGIGWNGDTGKGAPFLYYANGACCAEITLDTVTGTYNIDRVNIVHDVGESLNPAIDLGQVIGAFVQGMGWCTNEEVLWNDNGNIISPSPATYKIPSIMDIPDNIDVEFIENRKNVKGIKRSKAIGEPPLVFGEAVFFAIEDAVNSMASKGNKVQMKLPATFEQCLMTIRKLRGLD